MVVRGAGAIGAAAGYAMAQGFIEGDAAKTRLILESARPTAKNLFYAVKRVLDSAAASNTPVIAAAKEAQNVADEDAVSSQKIGAIGNDLIKDGDGILTHCNAGWLAFVDYGTALSPIYAAHAAGKKIHVLR